MTPADVAAQIELLVSDARDAGIDDETIAELRQNALDALREGLS